MPEDKPAEWMREIAAKTWERISERGHAETAISEAISKACFRQREIDAQIAQDTIQRLNKLGRKEHRIIEVNEFYGEVGLRIRKGGE